MFRTKCKEHDHSAVYKFLNMEQSHKNNDCYFFYYSTCTKGDSCGFRHEPSALGCEVMCTYWQQGNCLNEKCNFRHMELKKNRKAIACYWESQRGGCKKPHCPFMHSQPRPTINDSTPAKTTELPTKPVSQEWSNRPDDAKLDGSGTESDQGRGSSETGSFIGSPAVDPLIVNFDEESDSEGVASSPRKLQKRTKVPYCKTYEQIRLEEIQAESAAYYSFTTPGDYLSSVGGGKEKRVASLRTARSAAASPYSRDNSAIKSKSNNDNLGFKVLTLDEIKKRKHEAQSVKSDNLETNVDVDKIAVPLSRELTTLEELNSETQSSEAITSQKRSREIEEESNPTKRCRTANCSSPVTLVPPLRLKRRSPRRLDTSGDVCVEPSSDDKIKNDSRVGIEVRLCDSSTDESSSLNQQVATSSSIVKVNDKELATDDLKTDQAIDGHTHETDYLDSGSDDILKDIDALLTEKSA